MISKSPLRYPGGKVKLYTFMSNLINENTDNPPVYVEPFAGGAGLALELLFNGVVNRVKINDFDPLLQLKKLSICLLIIWTKLRLILKNGIIKRIFI